MTADETALGSALGWYAGLVAAGVVALPILGRVLGPRLRFAAKQAPFECGERAAQPSDGVGVRFALVALSFLLFQAAIALLVPWAVALGSLGWVGLLGALPFLAALGVGLTYQWLNGGLDRE